jgi:lipopolysaccharide transport system ATP-binding protein
MATASEFGAREVVIEQVSLHDDEGRALEMVDGGEIVTLTIGARVERRAPNLIFGFYLKDRLGQRLFGDNTYLTTLQAPVDGRPGQQPSARFTFRMPMLPVGAYSFDVAVASGTQDDHTQQHWIHDALTLRATDSSMRHGLVGIPMLDIGLSAGDPIA